MKTWNTLQDLFELREKTAKPLETLLEKELAQIKEEHDRAVAPMLQIYNETSDILLKNYTLRLHQTPENEEVLIEEYISKKGELWTDFLHATDEANHKMMQERKSALIQHNKALHQKYQELGLLREK